jgi:hypothetical protein
MTEELSGRFIIKDTDTGPAEYVSIEEATFDTLIYLADKYKDEAAEKELARRGLDVEKVMEDERKEFLDSLIERVSK